MRISLYGFLIPVISLSACSGSAQEIVIASANASDYQIIIPASPTKLESHAASVFQTYFQKVAGAHLDIVPENKHEKRPAFYIGLTSKAYRIHPAKLSPEGYLLQTDGKDLVIEGGSGKGLIYGVYAFLEQYLGCRKLGSDPAILHPTSRPITIPGRIKSEYRQQFIYREVYYPASNDPEYLEWNRLHRLDDLWGVWGHSYNKLVPANVYFKSHPEYFALVKGRRQASQLCLSNDDVFNIVVAELKKRMAANPDAIYWSISPNDDNGFCECDKCRATDDQQASHAGSLIKFVNRVAAVFPDKQFTTLAYGYTHKAPKSLKPASNVYVFLSDIDAYRDKPLETEGSAAAFRSDLRAWGAITPNLFIWDYITEFTNYLAPFPNFHTLQPNLKYLKDNGVKGIFAQGSGDTYGEWAELRSYVEAKLMQNTDQDANDLVASFVKDYYGDAAPYIRKYLDQLQANLLSSKRKLDIYGNPVNEWKTYLSPENLDHYSDLFDKAEAAVEGNTTLSDRVMRARLPLEYTVLQQARFFGIEQHGVFTKDRSGKWIVRPKFEDKVARFVANCKKAAVTEIAEANGTPDTYLGDWNKIFAAGVTPTKALGAGVSLRYPFAEDYPAKGNQTLVDGNPGYTDYSYNWLCFYGVPMVATIDLGKEQKITRLRMDFLDDPRHWIFRPDKITVEVSTDGEKFEPVENISTGPYDEHYDASVRSYLTQKSFRGSVRYIRVTAANLQRLPDWRQRDNKKPMIACSEIFVQ